MTRAIKVAVSWTLYYLGILQLWQAIVLRRRAVVLMYHRVLTDDERKSAASHPGIVVDEQTFARHMAVLRRRFVVLSIEEFADRLERRLPFPSSACLITFDDGWRDNYSNVLPILERHRLPALIFLPVNFIGARRVFWQEALTRLLTMAISEARRDPARRARFCEILRVADLDGLLDVADKDPKLTIMETVGARKHVSAATLRSVQTGLATELGVRLEHFARMDGFMDWSEVQTMSERGIAFGGHGAEHRLLTQISPEEAQHEVSASKAVLDRYMKKTVPTFSYPNGSWSTEIADTVKANGYNLAFTTRPGT